MGSLVVVDRLIDWFPFSLLDFTLIYLILLYFVLYLQRLLRLGGTKYSITE